MFVLWLTSHTLDVLAKLFSYAKDAAWDIVFFKTGNMLSINEYMENLKKEYDGVPEPCTLKPFTITKEMNTTAFLETVERLQKNMSDLMLARVPRKDFFRPSNLMTLWNRGKDGKTKHFFKKQTIHFEHGWQYFDVTHS